MAVDLADARVAWCNLLGKVQPYSARAAPPWHRADGQHSQRQPAPVSPELGPESEPNPSVVLSSRWLWHDYRATISTSTEGPIQYWLMPFLALYVGCTKREVERCRASGYQ